ncbi:hypothetical protein F5Y17DRAFT_294338 [Xylariaceae sp. FL0594]|nr:hypothetical protein F5Y17DRAFT_294338 [Xylariaceae sp. FL0594]
MQPSTRMHIAARVAPPTMLMPKTGSLATKKFLLPTLAWLGAAYGVSFYVRRQLSRESGDFDHIFAQQNTPEVEEARKKSLQVDVYGDPRHTLFNILGWQK